ncbi:MAG: hypothetical protein HOQ05_04625 [Corynebacteriales bacterium]|nr:hypothetical protein [Mycobacteriales bacterium]
MKAAAATQRRLLDLQALDTALSQLAHRRAHLPELSEISTVDEELATARAEQSTAQAAVDAVDKRIAAIESEIGDARSRIVRNEQRMDSGKVSVKDLENMGHEIQTLRARQTELEDSELELMEEQETVSATLNSVQTSVVALETRHAELAKRRDEQWTQIDADSAGKTVERESISTEIPDELLAIYEKARAAHGNGAALLRARRCEGCRLELYGTALEAARKAADDDIVRCEECRTILVRTPESGL